MKDFTKIFPDTINSNYDARLGRERVMIQLSAHLFFVCVHIN